MRPIAREYGHISKPRLAACEAAHMLWDLYIFVYDASAETAAS